MDRDLKSGQDLAKTGMILIISKNDQVMIGLDPECGRMFGRYVKNFRMGMSVGKVQPNRGPGG